MSPRTHASHIGDSCPDARIRSRSSRDFCRNNLIRTYVIVPIYVNWIICIVPYLFEAQQIALGLSDSHHFVSEPIIIVIELIFFYLTFPKNCQILYSAFLCKQAILFKNSNAWSYYLYFNDFKVTDMSDGPVF